MATSQVRREAPLSPCRELLRCSACRKPEPRSADFVKRGLEKMPKGENARAARVSERREAKSRRMQNPPIRSDRCIGKCGTRA